MPRWSHRHSERRQYFGETDETVNNKIKAAFAHGITPIVCIGESLEQNKAGETVDFVGSQIRGAFADISAEQAKTIVLAYEPIWAIGTGLTATPEDANGIIKAAIRDEDPVFFIENATLYQVRGEVPDDDGGAAEERAREVQFAYSWFNNITSDIFG